MASTSVQRQKSSKNRPGSSCPLATCARGLGCASTASIASAAAMTSAGSRAPRTHTTPSRANASARPASRVMAGSLGPVIGPDSPYLLLTGNICRHPPASEPTKTRETHVNEIRDAILADQLDAVGGLDV